MEYYLIGIMSLQLIQVIISIYRCITERKLNRETVDINKRNSDAYIESLKIYQGKGILS
jgi:hypothetical protein